MFVSLVVIFLCDFFGFLAGSPGWGKIGQKIHSYRDVGYEIWDSKQKLRRDKGDR